VRGIWRPTKVRNGDNFSQLPIFLERFIEGGEDVRTRTTKRDAGNIDGADRGKEDAFNRGTRPKPDHVPRRNPVANDVELVFIEAVGLEDFVNLVCMILSGGEEA